MEAKHHFIITRYCPKEQIFDGEMTWTQAHRFMDEHATNERRVGFKVFNEMLSRWEDFGDAYHGGRKVYDKGGELYILDPDYRSQWRPQACGWYVWEVSQGRSFVMSVGTKERAERIRDDCQSFNPDKKYIVEPADVTP